MRSVVPTVQGDVLSSVLSSKVSVTAVVFLVRAMMLCCFLLSFAAMKKLRPDISASAVYE